MKKTNSIILCLGLLACSQSFTKERETFISKKLFDDSSIKAEYESLADTVFIEYEYRDIHAVLGVYKTRKKAMDMAQQYENGNYTGINTKIFYSGVLGGDLETVCFGDGKSEIGRFSRSSDYELKRKNFKLQQLNVFYSASDKYRLITKASVPCPMKEYRGYELENN